MGQESSSKNSTWSKSRLKLWCSRTDWENCTMRNSGCRNKSRLPKSILISLTTLTRGVYKTIIWCHGTNKICRIRRIISEWLMHSDAMKSGLASATIKTVYLPITRVNVKSSSNNQTRLQTNASKWSMTTSQTLFTKLITACTLARTTKRKRTTPCKCITLTCQWRTSNRRLSMHVFVRLMKLV